MPNVLSKQVYVQGFYCETISFKAVNLTVRVNPTK